MRKRWVSSGSWPAIGLAVASSVIVFVPGPAAGVVCDLTWTGGSDHTSWNDQGNWGNAGVPSPGQVACISIADQVVIPDGTVADVAQLELSGGAMLTLQPTAQLFINGATPSVWEVSTSVIVTGGQIGGSGVIRLRGNATLGSATASATLTSRDPGLGLQPPADTGEMVVEGHATVTNLGAAIRTGFTLTVANGGSVTVAPGSQLSADDGTALTIQPGGLVDLAGNGGYYPGSDVSGLTKSVFTNNGTLRKTGGSGTSVVDAKYLGLGAVAVLSGTLAVPDNQPVGAAVSPGMTLATGRCDSAPVCQPTTNPAQDTMSLGFTVPGTNGAPVVVQLEERGAAADAEQVGNEVLAHADNLVPDAAHPARLSVRYSQADVMATPLGEVQVVHTDEAGRDALLPDCSGGTLPAGLYYCVVRPVTRDSLNTYVTVLAVTTSRWRLRRALPIEHQGSPQAPVGLKSRELAPFDGSVLELLWSAPASSGAGPVSGYRTYVDGKLRATTTATATSTVVKNAGAGTHAITVAAVNAAGEGTRASIKVTLDELSKPRKVAARRGASGGSLTAGVAWKPPAEAGGLTIKGYQVVVLNKAGEVVAKKKVGASKRKLMLTFSKRARYRFKVRAKNVDKYGPFSKPTDLTTPR